MQLVTSDLFPQQHDEASGPHDFTCLMAHLPRIAGDGLRYVQSHLHPEDVVKMEDEPHVTVLYGLHDYNPAQMKQTLNGLLNPFKLKFGALSLFSSRDGDVLKYNVESPDLHHLNSRVKTLPYTNSYNDYEPHATVAYLKPGTGEKYLSVPNPLTGLSVDVNHLILKSPSKALTLLPLSTPTVEEIVDIHSVWGVSPVEIAEMLTATAIGVRPMPMGSIRPISPNGAVKKRVSKPSVEASPKAGDPTLSRHFTEGWVHHGLMPHPDDDPSDDDLGYTHDTPSSLKVVDYVHGQGWNYDQRVRDHDVFTHEVYPRHLVLVNKKNQHPVWVLVHNKKAVDTGNDVYDLKRSLRHLEADYD